MLTKQDHLYLEKKKKEIIDSCPICHGRKPFCSCSYSFQLEYAKIKAGIPEKYRDFKIDMLVHPQLTKQKADVENILKDISIGNFSYSVLISGTKGLAKSSVAACILCEALKAKKTAFYYQTVYDLKNCALKGWNKETKNDYDYIMLSEADIIAIDGLGLGTVLKENAVQEVLDVLKRRMLLGKQVVFVSTVESKRLIGFEKDIVDIFSPKEIKFSGFDYVKNVLNKVKKAKKGI